MNTKKQVLGLVVLAATLLGWPHRALAQLVQPSTPPSRGAVPPGLVCTAEAANVSAFVGSDGSVAIYNVPSGASLIARATCEDQLGQTKTGHSPFVTPIPGGTAHFASFDFGTTVPLAAQLALSPASPRLVGLGSSIQLATSATFADQTTGDVTAAATGTTYRSSNPNVATVSANGLVTAVGPGTTLIFALHEGTGGLATVSVLPAALQSLAVSPASVDIVINPIFLSRTAQLRVTGALSGGGAVDMTPASSGVTYSSSNLAVARVGADGAVVGVSAGSAVITVTDTATGTTTQVPVSVTQFSPAPFAAYNTPGFAHNVDIDGNLAFVADGPGGLQIVDVTNGAHVGKLSFGGPHALDVRLRNKLAVVALGDAGFALVDVSDPTNPGLLSRTASTGFTRDLWVSGDVVYLASSDGLHVYDITDPAAPVSLGTQVFAGAANAVAADGARGVVAVLTDEPALVVLQANGALPWSAVSVPLPAAVNQADDVVIFGTSAYVANGKAGLVEIDVTIPASPSVKSSSSIVFNALGVALRRTDRGTVVAAADNNFVNAVPLFGERLDYRANIDFSTFPGDVKSDADGTGIALGDGFGVVTVGDAGIQVFRTQQLTDNAGKAPVVALSQPIDKSRLPSGDLHFIAATAVDDVHVASVDFLVDGVVVATDALPPFTAQVPAGAPCTTQTIEARATDLGGNVGASFPVQVTILCDDGQACSSNADCASGTCSGGTCQPCTAGLVVHDDCASLKAACPAIASSGTYTIDPDGAGPGAPFATYCEMKLGGGGWTMVAKFANQDAKHWIDAKTSWSDTTPYGAAADLSTGQDAKSPAWGALAATDFLITDDTHKVSGGYIRTTSACFGGQSMSHFFTTALANYPDFSGDTYFKVCPTYSNYIPNWTTDPNLYGTTPDSPSISLNQGYLTIAYTNGGDTQGIISFFALGNVQAGPDFLQGFESEADMGLGSSEQNGDAFGLGDTQKQDLGSTQWWYGDDASYIALYPDTVYVFAR